MRCLQRIFCTKSFLKDGNLAIAPLPVVGVLPVDMVFISDEAKQIQQQYLISVSWWEKAIILMISWYQNRPWKKSKPVS